MVKTHLLEMILVFLVTWIFFSFSFEGGNLDCEATSFSFCLDASFDSEISYSQTH